MMNNRQYCLLLLVAVASSVCGSEQAFDVITAKEFHLVDKDGKSRGAFGVDTDGTPNLFLKDKDGKIIHQKP